MGRVYNNGQANSGRRKGKQPGPSAWHKSKGRTIHKCSWHCRRKNSGSKITTYTYR